MPHIAKKLEGTGVALITPFREDLSVDFDGLSKLIDYVIDGGVEYLVCLGTTGESVVLSWQEKTAILEHTISQNKGRVPIVLGLGSNNTAEVTAKCGEIEKYEIDAVLSVSPYYNKPSQEGIRNHYTEIADHSPFPVILYNVPARTSSDVSIETILKLAEHPNIIGVKDASVDHLRFTETACRKPADFLLISGEDSFALHTVMVGGEGVISVMANYLPAQTSAMIREARKGNMYQARALHHQLLPFYKLCVAEGNPSSVKTGVEELGIAGRAVRLPLQAGSDELFRSFAAARKDMKKREQSIRN